MDEKLQPLSYARPIERRYRPPMYTLILTVMIAGGMIVLGLIAFVTFAVLFLQTNSQMSMLVPLCVAAGFFYIGTRSMRVAVRFLRGLPPVDRDWDRWIFWISLWGI